MNKAFVKETDDQEEEPERREILPTTVKNYMTPHGFEQLQQELRHLSQNERPKVVEAVTLAASHGDRSENGDYIYGKKRLREIDRRIHYLTRRMKSAVIVDPKQQQNLTRVFFGAQVTYVAEKGVTKTIKIVGVDEADFNEGKISWRSPLATALLKSQVGDVVELRLAAGIEQLKILEIEYSVD